jgi:hypothetical protein
MAFWMTPHQRWYWQALLELTLRRLHGDAFQGFFSDVMSKLHGDDFVPVRAFGRRGDKGCDGYLLQSGQLFQCYGKLHDAGLDVDGMVGKMEKDYGKAVAGLSVIMKEWHFVHNLFDGFPVEAIVKLKELEAANSQHKFGFIGPQGFEDRVLRLDEEHVVALLGPAATAADTQNMRMEEVSDLIKAVMTSVDADQPDTGPIAVVPYDKLETNKIAGCWHHLLVAGFSNAPHVRDYIDRHPEPELGTHLARVFKARYENLKLQGLKPNAILASLYEGITGVGSVSPERQVAAHALLAYLFEACDIFEDHPSKVNA